MFGIKRNLTDSLFSDIVRMKANWCCERCLGNFINRKDILDCSHFITRGNKRLRWDLSNVSCLCRGCHIYFGQNPDEHTQFMQKKLGAQGFAALQMRKTRQWNDQKIDEKMIRLGLKQMLKNLTQEQDLVLGSNHE